MSARAIEIPADHLVAERVTDGSVSQRPAPAPEVALSAAASEGLLGGLEASARFTEDLLRRLEVPYPLPWPHGGLNE
jgi:hypothetical protein